MNRVPGDSLTDQAVRVAGALAELSIVELNWRAGNSPNATLRARITDLPALLTTARAGSCLHATPLDLSIEVQPVGLVWRSTNPNHAAAFAAALGSS